jgi:hypothetical protein
MLAEKERKFRRSITVEYLMKMKCSEQYSQIEDVSASPRYNRYHLHFTVLIS